VLEVNRIVAVIFSSQQGGYQEPAQEEKYGNAKSTGNHARQTNVRQKYHHETQCPQPVERRNMPRGNRVPLVGYGHTERTCLSGLEGLIHELCATALMRRDVKMRFIPDFSPYFHRCIGTGVRNSDIKHGNECRKSERSGAAPDAQPMNLLDSDRKYERLPLTK
jgi:hypothetical protein